jgi:hypothetical protein
VYIYNISCFDCDVYRKLIVFRVYNIREFLFRPVVKNLKGAGKTGADKKRLEKNAEHSFVDDRRRRAEYITKIFSPVVQSSNIKRAFWLVNNTNEKKLLLNSLLYNLLSCLNNFPVTAKGKNIRYYKNNQ